MSNQPTAGDIQSKRPQHIHTASLGTNASGIPDSTISYAGSEWSGISQFPPPPAELPTPILSTFNTPTSLNFTERFPPSIPGYETPTRLQFSTPPTRSPANSHFSGISNGQGGQSVKSVPKFESADVRIPPAPKMSVIGGQPVVRRPSGSSSSTPLTSQPSTGSYQIRSLTTRKDSSPHPPVVERLVPKRPGTPHSIAATSSLLDWSDATSCISIDPSEERLLSTSFITGLLSQSPDPFPRQKRSDVRSKLIRRLDMGNDVVVSQPSRNALPVETTPPHQSIPPSYPSDLLTTGGREALNPRSTSTDDRRSRHSDSKRASKDYSDTLHSDEQVQPVVRKPSITISRRGIEARPMAVTRALRVSYRSDATDNSGMTLTNSMITSNSLASKPPVHHADAPQNVRQTMGFDGDGILRESEEEYAKMGCADGYLEPGSNAPSAMPGSQGRSAGSNSGSRSNLNQASGSKYTLQRTHSRKSVVSSLVSRISNSSAAHRAKTMAWLKNRPLPPLPKSSNRAPEFPNGREIQKEEEVIPLPMLAKRAEGLSGVLNGGRYPSSHDSYNEFYYKEATAPEAVPRTHNRDTYTQMVGNVADGASQRLSFMSYLRQRRADHNNTSLELPSPSNIAMIKARRKRRQLCVITIGVILVIALAVAIPVGLSQRNKSSARVCNGNQTGVGCTLDATCICTQGSGSCKPLARSLSLLLTDVNDLFTVNFTGEELSDAVVAAVGGSSDGLCANQASLLDVEPGLNSAAAPNRTSWAQAAMLWNLGMSEDVVEANDLQKFVSTAPWSSLSSVDGPVNDDTGNFAKSVSGFTFNFAAQTITPRNASFKDSSPSETQLTELSDDAEKVLDRMYSFAIASSTQREKAFLNYWTSVLQRQESEMTTFLDAVQNSPFLIPFDATSSVDGNDLSDLMASSSSTQFPIPISCYPGLSDAQLSRINSLETPVFGLSSASSNSDFSSSCFPGRPVYGVVDLLRLRLPFPDDRKGVALQATALTTDATVRTVVYNGEILSALPGGTPLTNATTSTMDPREFGTPDFLNHVLLNYLSSIPNVTLAMGLVSHVLSSSNPANTSDLTHSLSSLPVLEFAVFGSIRPQDIAYSVSSFSTPTGSLFFGSDASQKFRSWALVNTDASVVWAETATSSDVVHEGSSTDEDFESVWKPASELAASGSTDASDVQKVTSSLHSLGLFSS